jgi:hypothetical protein
MAQFGLAFAAVALATLSIHARTLANPGFKLALPEHSGQLRWSADGFKILENSAKPNGHEIGIRGRDGSGRLTFLGFLFLFPEQAPLTSAKCRDGVLNPEKNSNPTLKIVQSSEIARPGGSLPVSLVTYTSRAKDGTTLYMVRGFIATDDACGDLEFFSSKPISSQDADLKEIFSSYQLDENYTPTSRDVFVYAQVLYQARMFKAAAPIFEAALTKLTDDPAPCHR